MSYTLQKFVCNNVQNKRCPFTMLKPGHFKFQMDHMKWSK